MMIMTKADNGKPAVLCGAICPHAQLHDMLLRFRDAGGRGGRAPD